MLQHIFSATGSQAFTKESLEKSVKHFSEIRERLVEIISPWKPVLPEEEKEKLQEKVDNQVKYIELIGSQGGFKSLDQILAAQEAVREIISKN